MKDHHDESGQQKQTGKQDLAPFGKTQIAHQPEENAMQTVTAADGYQEHDHGGKKGIDDDPGQKQRVGLAIRPGSRHAENRDDRQQRPDEGQTCNAERNGAGADENADDGSHGGASGDAENIRIGQRVPENGLKHDAGGGQGGSDDPGKENARKANGKQNGLFRWVEPGLSPLKDGKESSREEKRGDVSGARYEGNDTDN